MIEYGLATVYGVVTVAFLAATLAERARDDRAWDRMRVAGLALCFLWPAAVLVLIALACMGEWGKDRIRRFVQGPSVLDMQADD